MGMDLPVSPTGRHPVISSLSTTTTTTMLEAQRRRSQYGNNDDDDNDDDNDKHTNNNYYDTSELSSSSSFSSRGSRDNGQGGRGRGRRRSGRDEANDRVSGRGRRGGGRGRGRGRGIRRTTNRNNSNYDNNFLDDDDDDDDEDNFRDPQQLARSSRAGGEHTNILDAITETNSHFFSKKQLSDPSLKMMTSKHQQPGKEKGESELESQDDSPDNSAIFEDLCQRAGITRPSRIQSLAWPVLGTGQTAIVADQTGSGKTLAYLIPLVKKILEADKEEALLRRDDTTNTNKKKYGAPKLLILAPTAELADQIKTVCSKISDQHQQQQQQRHVNHNNNNEARSSSAALFTTMVVTANGKYTTSIRDQIRMLQRQSVDVLISTPGRVSTILRTRNSGLDLSDLHAIVLDEVDILLIDDTFGPQLRTVSKAIIENGSGSGTTTTTKVIPPQFVFVTATLPDTIVKTVQQEFPTVVQVRGPGLHRTAPSLKETLIDVSVPAEYNRNPEYCFDVKAEQLRKALRLNKARRTLIFCNTVDSCRDVENLLSRKDRRGRMYQIGAYHNALSPDVRNINLQKFIGSSSSSSSSFSRRQSRSSSNRKNTAEDSILICTDRAGRGVDFDTAPVDHVVVFDFPKDPAEYVRRVGRTARCGRSGACTVFAHGWQLPIARTVMGKRGTGTTATPGGGGGGGAAINNKKIAINDIMMFDDGYNNNNNDDDDDNYQFGKKHRKRNTKKSKIATIKENIENGSLWD